MIESATDITNSHLVLLGASGHGRAAADIAQTMGWGRISFLDEDWPARVKNRIWPVIGTDDALSDLISQGAYPFVSIGSNVARERAFNTHEVGIAPSLVHPSAVVSNDASIGIGAFIAPMAVINIASRLGRGVIVNTAASIDHDCAIGDFVHISPGARLAGGVSIGDRSWVGIGSVVREGVRIGRDAMIAGGSAVIHDVPDGRRMGGVPAKEI